jgi:hypothetical protein
MQRKEKEEEKAYVSKLNIDFGVEAAQVESMMIMMTIRNLSSSSASNINFSSCGIIFSDSIIKMSKSTDT